MECKDAALWIPVSAGMTLEREWRLRLSGLSIGMNDDG